MKKNRLLFTLLSTFFCSFFCFSCNDSSDNSLKATLQLPQDGATIDLSTETEVRFRWKGDYENTEQVYQLLIGTSKDMSSAKSFEVKAKMYVFPIVDFDTVLEEIGVAQGEFSTIYWTAKPLSDNLQVESQVWSFNIVRPQLIFYDPVIIYDYTGHTFYVDSENGDDSKNGTSEATAWKTLTKVNNYSFNPGDIIRFKCGGLWRGQLKARSGAESNPLVYTSYGNGRKPILQGSISRNEESDWTETSPGIWETGTDSNLDVGNIIFDNGKEWGVKKFSTESITKEKDYFSDKENKKFYLKYNQNPASHFQSIELALGQNIVDYQNVSYVTFDGLAIRYGGVHGFGGCCNHNLVVRRCDISWIGGSADNNQIRLGNGIEFWIGTHDNLIENNRIWEIYDAGLTNQGSDVNTQENIIYRNNVIWNTEMSFEFWNRPESSITKNILFEHNTCVNAGGGWGYSQRPDPNGTHLNFYAQTSQISDFVIRNNVFVNANNAIFRMDSDWSNILQSDYNLYYTQGDLAFFLFHRYNTIEDMQNAVGLELNSVFADPRFVDADRHDYRLFVPVIMSNGQKAGILQWDPEWNGE